MFTLDTGVLFPETYALWRALEAALRHHDSRGHARADARAASRRARRCAVGARPRSLLRAAQGAAAARALAGFDAWITAIRRDQTRGARDRDRSSSPIRKFGLVKVNPLVDVDARRRVGPPLRERRPVQPAARAGLSVDRLPAVHVARRARREPARRSLARLGEERVRPHTCKDEDANDGCALSGVPQARRACPSSSSVAARSPPSKLDGLLAAGARVTVVAPELCGAILERAERDAITVIEQPFRAAHLAGARWVVAAATPEVNRDVAAAAAARGLFVNAVDDPSVATAYLGGVVRRGPVEIAISTGGLAPALAGLLARGARRGAARGSRALDRRRERRARRLEARRRADGRAPAAAAARARSALLSRDASRSRSGAMTGFVSLVGAGPGDPELLTRARGRSAASRRPRALRRARRTTSCSSSRRRRSGSTSASAPAGTRSIRTASIA